jgi:hypothetical protein
MTLTSNALRMFSAGMSTTDPPSKTPALFTKMSTFHASAFLRSPSSVTSSFPTCRGASAC